MSESVCDTNNITTDFLRRFDISHNTLVENTKTILIQTLKEVFAGDPVFTWREDQHGFPVLPKFRFVDTGEEGGVDGVDWGDDPNDVLTNIVITDIYRYDVKFLPAITVRFSSGSNQDVSFNQEQGSLKWAERELVRNGELVFERIPSHYIFAGSWNKGYAINIMAEDTLTRELLVDRISLIFMHLKRKELESKGVFVKNVSMGSESEEAEGDDPNEKYYNCSINLDIYSEWYREVPIHELIEKVEFNIELLESILTPFQIKLLKAYYSNRNRVSDFYSSLLGAPAYDNSTVGKIDHGNISTLEDLFDDLL